MPAPALLVVLETLTPAERTAWVLHDLFGMEFTEIAGVVGRAPAAVRQLAARARKHVTARAPRIDVNTSEHRAAVAAFFRASAGGDLAALVAVLDPDVTLTSDGGGAVGAARRPVHGADRVARFIIGVAGKVQPGQRAASVIVNGAPGLAVFQGEQITAVASLTVAGSRITRVDLILAPGKLPHLHMSCT